MLTEVLTFLVTVIVLIFFYDGKFRSKKYLQGIPGPTPLPILGNALDFMTSPSKFLPKVMKNLETYGEVVLYRLGPFEKLILVTDYKLTEHILSSTKIIQKSYQYEFFHNWLGTGIFTSTGTKWKIHRKMLTPCFHFSILTKYVQVFESMSDKFIQILEKEVGKPSLEIQDLASLCSLDIICETAMGISINALDREDSEYVTSVKTMCTIITQRIISPLDKRFYWLTPNYFKEKKVTKVLNSFGDKVIDARIKSRNNNKYSNAVDDEDADNNKNLTFVDLLLDITIDGKPLTRLEIRDEVNTFMFGGHDTIACAMTFALYSLADNPDVQQKVLDEQRRIFGNHTDVNVTVSDLQEMKYLELVIKETLRLYPPGPMIARQLTEDLEWDGTTFPKGQALSIFVFGIHRNAKYFPDPEKFIPERFESNEEKKPFSFIPFSAGPRNCVGQRFAMLEMKSILSKIVRNFELHPSEPAHILQLSLEAVLGSENGVCISLKKRKWI